MSEKLLAVADYLDELPKNLIDQRYGWSLYVDGFPPAEQKAAQKVLDECPRCFGAIIADCLGADVDYVKPHSLLDAELRKHGLEKDAVPVRTHVRGAAALERELLLGSGYKEFLNNPRDLNGKKLKLADTCAAYRVAWYLHVFCGAPEQCFCGEAWPEGVGMGDVLRKVVGLGGYKEGK